MPTAQRANWEDQSCVPAAFARRLRRHGRAALGCRSGPRRRRTRRKDRRMLREHYPYYLANRAVAANRDLPVVDKYTGKVATHVALADEAAIDQAIAAAVEAAEPM